MNQDSAETDSRQRVFNLPAVILALIAALIVIHVLRVGVLSAEQSDWLIVNLGFFPGAFAGEVSSQIPPEAGGYWTFVTYAFLHGNYVHLILNCVWLAAFGSPLAWRFGTARFLLFSAAGAVAGAATQLAIHPDGMIPMVGASAAISAHMAAAARFALGSGGPLALGMRGTTSAWRQPARPLSIVLRDSRVLTFLGVWFGLNLLIGLAGGNGGLASGIIAWEAHIGGFLAGMVLFPVFDPIPGRRP